MSEFYYLNELSLENLMGFTEKISGWQRFSGTEEELEAAAKGYLEQAVPGDWNISEVKIQENAFYSEGFGASRSVDIALADGRKYRLGVSEQDLTVLNFIVEKA